MYLQDKRYYLTLKFFIILDSSLLLSLAIISCLLSLTFLPRQSPISNFTLFPSLQYALSGTIVIPGVLSVFCNILLASCLCSNNGRGRRSSWLKNSPAVLCLPICTFISVHERPFLFAFTKPSLIFILPSRMLFTSVPSNETPTSSFSSTS